MSQARLYIATSLFDVSELKPLHTQSADIEHVLTASFGIDDARSLQERAWRRPVEATIKNIVVQFSSVTSEAQNALLKLLEEPPETTVLHVVVPNEELLLPTVRSRLLLIETAVATDDTIDFDAFMNLSYGERLDSIAKKTKDKDVAWSEAIVRGAEKKAQAELKKGAVASAKSGLLVRQYLGARGSSTKMLLEEIALAL